jgi:hypothetical protein
MSKFKDISSASVKTRSTSLMPTKDVPIVNEPKQKSGTIVPSSTTPFLRREIKSNVRTRRVSGRVSDLSYEDPKELASVFEELRKGKIQWMMLSYTDIQENPYILKVNSKGEGGVDSYKKLFSEEEIYFIITRLDQDESLESVRENIFTFFRHLLNLYLLLLLEPMLLHFQNHFPQGIVMFSWNIQEIMFP